MKITVVELEVQGPLIFVKEQYSVKDSTLAPSPLMRTSIFLHNYPFFYGLMGVSSEKIVSETGQPEYTLVKEAVKEKIIYIYPPKPESVKIGKVFLAARGDTLFDLRPKMEKVFPMQVFYYTILPGSKYITAIVHDDDFTLPPYIRIGKKRWGIIRLKELPVREYEKIEPKYSTIPVNIGDLKDFNIKILDYNSVLITRNYPYIGEKAVIAYAKCEPTHRVKYIKGGKERTLYIPLIWI
ncbi:MAG: type I-D CRISPR-associated protein Cas5/Csc1 [Thermoprotei archaeon]|nr:MAG: type I-D CRISPR-associated protein Cas5/Csc1 [Thermoprotei archaeon]